MGIKRDSSHTHIYVWNTGHPHGFQFWHLAGLSSRLSLPLNLSCLRFHAALAILCPNPIPPYSSSSLSFAQLHLQRLSLVVVAAVTVACLLSFIYLTLFLFALCCFISLFLLLAWKGNRIRITFGYFGYKVGNFCDIIVFDIFLVFRQHSPGVFSLSFSLSPCVSFRLTVCRIVCAQVKFIASN